MALTGHFDWSAEVAQMFRGHISSRAESCGAVLHSPRAARVRLGGAGECEGPEQVPAPGLRRAVDGGGGAHRQGRARLAQDQRDFGRGNQRLLCQAWI